MEPSRHIPTRITRYLVRVFEVAPDAPAAAPAPLPDRHVEAASVDDARAKATALFAAERRPLRSLVFLDRCALWVPETSRERGRQHS